MNNNSNKTEDSIALIFDLPFAEQINPDENRAQKKERAIVNYILNGNLPKTASQFKISEATLRSWICECSEDEINAYRIQAYKKIIDKTVALVTKTISVQEAKLVDIANDPCLRRRISLSELSNCMANNLKILSRLSTFCNGSPETIQIENTQTKKLEDFI